ncbi:MAG TPA: ferritin-like domain-containing protein [Streptosporangiaceae bacterium]|nr:ferritin-like domain-containing protein [Streptosporangiaceae bacterium]
MALLQADKHQFGTQSYQLFTRAQERAPWSARELIGSGKTALDGPGLERAWYSASMGYYTEQAGLVAAAELAGQTEDAMLRLGLATAVADEARHADAFLTYAVARGGDIADCADEGYLGELHGTLSSASYLEKCLLHTMLEGFAADEFILLQRIYAGDPLGAIIRFIRADEIRHVAIGLDYLRRSYADPRDRAEWDAHGIEWEQEAVELTNLPAAAPSLGDLLGQQPRDLERWFMRRHCARMRGAGIPTAGGR